MTPEERATALAEDVVRQWFSRSVGAMDSWEKWKPIWTAQLTEQFSAELEEVRRETWEAAAKMLDEDDVLLTPDELDSHCKCQCFAILGRLSNKCREQAGQP